MSAYLEDYLLDNVFWYAAMGFPVFPCEPKGKKPLTTHGCKDATCDPAQIRDWWRYKPYPNIAIAIPVGWIVLDIDGAEGEAAVIAAGVNLSATAESKTGRGRHLWYRLPKGVVAKNKVGVLNYCDIRAQGGYCIVPPSVHPSGAVYSWRVELDQATLAPAWLISAATAASNNHKIATHPDKWAALARDGVFEGERNATLASLAGHLLRQRVDPRVVLHLAIAWNVARCRPPMPEAEVLRTVDSITAAELRRRGLK